MQRSAKPLSVGSNPTRTSIQEDSMYRFFKILTQLLKILTQLLFHIDTLDGSRESYTKPTQDLSDAELLNEAANILDLSEEHIFEHVRKKTGTVTDYSRCFSVSGDFRLPPYMRQWIRKHLGTLRLTL